MTPTPIQETLAKEFSIRPEQVAAVLALLDAGYAHPYIARIRRADVGELPESLIRRLDRRRRELDELDRRRATILRLAESAGADERALHEIRDCYDRFELEDLVLPFRRPEPEVQLALDRGLGALADLLVQPGERPAKDEARGEEPALDDLVESDLPQHEPEASADAHASAEAAQAEIAQHEAAAEAEAAAASEGQPAESAAEPAGAEARASEPSAPLAESFGHEPSKLEMTLSLARACAPFVQTDRGVHSDQEALAGAMRVLSDRLGRNPRLRSTLRRMLRREGTVIVRALVDDGQLGRHRSVARLRVPLRQLQGARLVALRQAWRDRAVSVAILIDRNRALAKVRQALGQRLQPEFRDVLDLVATQSLDRRLLPMIEEDVRLELKERADDEAMRALTLHLRTVLLSPMLGAKPVAGLDVNAKGDWVLAVVDAEGVHQLREAPPEPEPPAAAAPEAAPAPEAAAAAAPAEAAAAAPASAAASAESSAPAAAEGAPAAAPDAAAVSAAAPAATAGGAHERRPKPRTHDLRIEVGKKTPEELGNDLLNLLDGSGVLALAMPHGRLGRAALPRVRAALAAVGVSVPVMIVNDSGLVAYANSELARRELPGTSVPTRLAIGLARRLQDPLAEFVKIDGRLLVPGPEVSLVTKAQLRRALTDALESAVAFVGCDVNSAGESQLALIPGVGPEGAAKILARRAERAFESRADLRDSGILSPTQWASAAASLRVFGSSEPFDATSLHPEQYEIARTALEAAGRHGPAELGHAPGLRELSRDSFGLDEATWRDISRELSHPPRDPRLRVLMPRLLPPDTDPKAIAPDTVVEGLVTNVTGFAAFVDIGLERDAIVHISELSERYVRDAREILSIGQWVRARVADSSGQRVALSLKNVPERQRPRVPGQGGEGGGRHGGPREGGEGRGRGGRGRRDEGGRFEDEGPKSSPFVRAAQTRRDGMVVGSGRNSRFGKGGGGKRGPGQGGMGGGMSMGGGRGGGRDRGPKLAGEEGYDPRDLRERTAPAVFRPFASFFKKGEEPSPPAQS